MTKKNEPLMPLSVAKKLKTYKEVFLIQGGSKWHPGIFMHRRRLYLLMRPGKGMQWGLVPVTVAGALRWLADNWAANDVEGLPLTQGKFLKMVAARLEGR